MSCTVYNVFMWFLSPGHDDMGPSVFKGRKKRCMWLYRHISLTLHFFAHAVKHWHKSLEPDMNMFVQLILRDQFCSNGFTLFSALQRIHSNQTSTRRNSLQFVIISMCVVLFRRMSRQPLRRIDVILNNASVEIESRKLSGELSSRNSTRKRTVSRRLLIDQVCILMLLAAIFLFTSSVTFAVGCIV